MVDLIKKNGLRVSLLHVSSDTCDRVTGEFELRTADELDRLVSILQTFRPCFEKYTLARHDTSGPETGDAREGET